MATRTCLYLTPYPPVGVERRDLALECGPFGRIARRDNLLAAAPRFGLESEQATRIIDEVKNIVAKHWREEVRRMGGTVGECDVIAPAFVYEGFEYVTE